MKINAPKSIFVLVILLFVSSVTISGQDSVNPQDSLPEVKKTSQKPWTVSPFSVRLGAFCAVNDLSAGAGLTNKPYTVLDFEDDLGMNRDAYSVLLNLSARFRKHHRIDFSFYNINQSTSATLDNDIHFGEHDYPVDAEIKAFLDVNIYRLSYGYSFLSNEKIELGALVGFHVMTFDLGMDLIGENRNVSFGDRVAFTAPLPDFGIWGTYAFHNRWAVSLEAGYFTLSVSDFKGSILSGNLAVQYKINKHWEADLGFTNFNVKATLDRQFLKSDLKWNYFGPSVSMTYKFGRLSD